MGVSPYNSSKITLVYKFICIYFIIIQIPHFVDWTCSVCQQGGKITLSLSLEVLSWSSFSDVAATSEQFQAELRYFVYSDTFSVSVTDTSDRAM